MWVWYAIITDTDSVWTACSTGKWHLCTLFLWVLFLVMIWCILYGLSSHPDIDDLIDIGDYLVNLKKDQIFRLGLVLGLRAVPTLDVMKDSPTFLYDMLTAWLQGQDNVGRRGGHTWGALVKGLRHPSVSQNETADKIQSEKCQWTRIWIDNPSTVTSKYIVLALSNCITEIVMWLEWNFSVHTQYLISRISLYHHCVYWI